MPPVAQYSNWNGLMRFRRLDATHHIEGVVTVGWRFTDNSNEAWTRRFNSFKAGKAAAIAGAQTVLGDALRRVRWGERRIALTSALSSGDTALRPESSLAQLGQNIANRIGVPWLDELLTKDRHAKLHRIANAWDRDNEVRNKYQAAPLDVEVDFVLVIDDLVTRGATVSEIARAIKDANPNVRVIGVALGKSESMEYARSFGLRLDNSHIPQRWARSWDSARRAT